MQPWAVGQTFSRFSEHRVGSTLTGTQPGVQQDQELWQECLALRLLSHVLVVGVPLSTSTHKPLQWSVDTFWTH